MTNPSEEQHAKFKRYFKEIARLAIIALAYFAATQIGLYFIAHPQGVASVWPSSGVALAALLLTEQRKWFRVLWVIFATNTLGNFSGGNTLLVSLGFALANIAETTLAAWVLVSLCGPKITFELMREVIALGIAALVINGLTAFLGASVPALGFGAPYFHTWFTWWVADGLGIILVTPVIVSWATSPRSTLSRKPLGEGGILLAIVIFLSWAIFNPSTSQEYQLLDVYILFPLLTWAALRFNQRFTTSLILIFASITIWQTVHGVTASSAFRPVGHELLSIQLLISVVTFSALILAAAVTERRWSLNALLESERNYRDFVEGTDDLITRVDEQGYFTFVNRMSEKYFGLRPEECIGISAFDFIHADDQTMTIEWFEKCVAQKLQKASLENRQVNSKTNEIFSFLWTTNFDYDTRGQLKNNKGIGRDITERKQAEQELENIFTLSSDMICIADIEGYFKKINPAWEKILGYTHEELLSRPYIDFIHPDDLEKTKEVIDEKLRRGITVLQFENRYRCKDGSYKWFSWTSNPAPHQGITFAVARDVTDSKLAAESLRQAHAQLEEKVLERTQELEKTHEQLLHSEKLAAIGGLSASIAHEFNNPLQGVLTVLKGIKRRTAFAEEDAKLVDMAVSECDRMKNLIKSLQDFNRPTSGRLAPTNIHATIDSILLLSKEIYRKKGITIQTNYAKNIPQIIVVADQIKQVLLNLLNNSAYACEGGGTITISTEMVDKKTIAIKVQDTGTGIKPEHLDKIFDPFFTTKPDIKGTGLGLSVSYGIIKQHGGTIEVESEPEKGTTFTISLPLEGVQNA